MWCPGRSPSTPRSCDDALVELVARLAWPRPSWSPKIALCHYEPSGCAGEDGAAMGLMRLPRFARWPPATSSPIPYPSSGEQPLSPATRSSGYAPSTRGFIPVAVPVAVVHRRRDQHAGHRLQPLARTGTSPLIHRVWLTVLAVVPMHVCIEEHGLRAGYLRENLPHADRPPEIGAAPGVAVRVRGRHLLAYAGCPAVAGRRARTIRGRTGRWCPWVAPLRVGAPAPRFPLAHAQPMWSGLGSKTALTCANCGARYWD